MPACGSAAAEQERKGRSMSAVISNVEQAGLSAAASANADALWMMFRVAAAPYGVPLAYVSKVLPVMTLRDVPGTPDHVRGLMNVHGQSVPVVDFAALAGIAGDRGYSLESPILLIECGNWRLGLLIDEVLGIETLHSKVFEEHADVCETGGLFHATTRTDHGQALCVDVERLCALGRPGGA